MKISAGSFHTFIFSVSTSLVISSFTSIRPSTIFWYWLISARESTYRWFWRIPHVQRRRKWLWFIQHALLTNSLHSSFRSELSCWRSGCRTLGWLRLSGCEPSSDGASSMVTGPAQNRINKVKRDLQMTLWRSFWNGKNMSTLKWQLVTWCLTSLINKKSLVNFDLSLELAIWYDGSL